MRTLIGNTIVGLILLFLTNLFLADDIPINFLTVVICALLVDEKDGFREPVSD